MTFDPLDTVALTTCGDPELLAAQASLVAERRRVDARLAAVAAEISRRSAPDAGMEGLAQRSGDRTAARLIERTAGLSQDEARRLIEVGARVRDSTDALGAAVIDGRLSVASAAAISGELDKAVGVVDAETRRAAEGDLIEAAGVLSVGEVRREARAYRDALDVEGIPQREERLRAQRRLTLTKLDTGMTRVEGLFDPESAALIPDAFDQVMSPRRGGPRFVDPDDVARAQRIVDDPRTTEQLMADAFVDMVRVASAADPGELFGSTTPAVRVHVDAGDLERGVGAAFLEGRASRCRSRRRSGSPAPGSSRSCSTRRARFWTSVGSSGSSRRPSVARSPRDGGCLVPGCDRPPAWCEAHHADEWGRHRGRTDVDRGVLLCAHHHRWVHAHRHRVVLRDGGYGMVHGTTGEFIPWPSRNPIRARARARAG